MDPHTRIKSDFVNALLPLCIRNGSRVVVAFVVLYASFYLVNTYGTPVPFLNMTTVLIVTGISLLHAIGLMSKQLIKILFTEFSFYEDHVESHFKFISEKTHSVNYSKITDVEVKKTLWDRICGVGDIVLHTANDGTFKQSLVLNDIKHPEEIKDKIITMISK